jgi:hypothetical protein
MSCYILSDSTKQQGNVLSRNTTGYQHTHLPKNTGQLAPLGLPGALDTEGFMGMKRPTLQQDKLQLHKANRQHLWRKEYGS